MQNRQDRKEKCTQRFAKKYKENFECYANMTLCDLRVYSLSDFFVVNF